MNKILIYSFILCCHCGIASAQTDTLALKAPDNTIYSSVEQTPEFVGGQDALYEYLTKNIVMPQTEENVQGSVIVNFVVDTSGNVINTQVLRGVHQAFDAEAIRVISNMPKWVPGKQNGKNVNVQYNIPIRFASNNKSRKKN